MTRVGDLAEGGSAGWQVVLYWDAELAGPELGRAAGRTLARQAGRLTGRGETMLIVSAGMPQVAVPPTRRTTGDRSRHRAGGGSRGSEPPHPRLSAPRTV